MGIRPEQAADIPGIHAVIVAAFAKHRYSNRKEQDIVGALRAANALTVSLVAVEREHVIGRVACSPITIEGKQ